MSREQINSLQMSEQTADDLIKLALDGKVISVDALYEKTGYVAIAQEDGGPVFGLAPMLMTAAIAVGISAAGYERRFCYASLPEALQAFMRYKGVGDPPGMWIKEKPSERLGPGASS